MVWFVSRHLRRITNILLYIFLVYKKKFSLPSLYTIMIVVKIKEGLLKKEKVKCFFIFMNILSFKKFKSSYSKREP